MNFGFQKAEKNGSHFWYQNVLLSIRSTGLLKEGLNLMSYLKMIKESSKIRAFFHSKDNLSPQTPKNLIRYVEFS